MPELERYLERIGYHGPREASAAVLDALVLAHTRSIAFENLNPRLGWPVRLDPEALFEKIVAQGRGGYCYEHNLLFMRMLQALGFEVTGLAARVLWNSPPELVRPRTHMLLLVRIGSQARIADVGFGGLTLTGTLALAPGLEQPTPHEPFRLLAEGDEYLMQARVAGEWKALYRFDLQPQLLADYELTSWYLCHHPQSHFRTSLIAARADAGCRYALAGNQLTIHRTGGASERRLLQEPQQLRAVLQNELRIRLPQSPQLDELLAALTR